MSECSVKKFVAELFSNRCAINPSHEYSVIHHIIPRSVCSGDHDIPDNLIPLCNECHSMVHREGTKLWRYRLQEIRESIK